jgi:hypothetical protein
MHPSACVVFKIFSVNKRNGSSKHEDLENVLVIWTGKVNVEN